MKTRWVSIGVLAAVALGGKGQSQGPGEENYFPEFRQATWTYVSPGGRRLSVQAALVTGPNGERISQLTFEFVRAGSGALNEGGGRTIFYFTGSGQSVVFRKLLNLDGLYDRARMFLGRQVGGEYEWFRLSAKPGDSWETVGNDIWTPKELGFFKVTLVSNTELVESAGRQYRNCLQFRITQTNGSHATWDQYLARGVGMVRLIISSRQNDPYELQSLSFAK